MRVAIVAPSSVPPTIGGAERLYDGLHAAFAAAGYDAELVTIASPEHSFRQLVDSYEAFTRLDVAAFDLVVSTKYPSWMVRHPNHVVYMLHPLRGLYDTYHLFGMSTDVAEPPPEAAVLVELLNDTPLGTRDGARRVLDAARWVSERLTDDHPACAFPGPLVRRLIHWLDQDAMDPAHVKGHFAISRTVTLRPEYFPHGVHARSLPPPSALTGLTAGPYRSFFTASRLDAPKRVDLLIDAMRHVPQEVQLRIAGAGSDEARLRSLAAEDARVVFLGRVDEDQLRAEYGAALAVPFVPLDEDFGLVAVEAQRAAKAVITCADSGGVTELVDDEINGLVVEPEAAAIGGAMRRLADDPRLAEALGRRGAQSVESITWENVIGGLLTRSAATDAEPAPRASRPATTQRPHLVVLSTYPASRARGGGQLRLNRLIRGLMTRFDIELLTLDDAGGEPGVTELGPGCRQTVVARGPEQLGFEGGLGARAPIPIGDIAAALFVDRTRSYIDQVHDAAHGAVGAVLAHPYLLPALFRAAPQLPFVYDAHNAETDMKRALLAGSDAADELTAVVEAVERHAVRAAELVVTCSPEDRATLEKLGPTLASWALAPNGADVFDTKFVSEGERARNRDALLAALHRSTGAALTRVALFVASYHPPNLEAAEAIVAAAPALPHVAFLLVGSHGNHFSTWRLPPNVFLAGTVSDRSLRQMLAAADVALNPIRSGGGTNLKLIEYFAAGAPVVSSALGVRGIDAAHGRELLVADDVAGADHLVGAIAATLADPGAAAQRARRARALAEAHYDWVTIAEGYAVAIEATFGGTDW